MNKFKGIFKYLIASILFLLVFSILWEDRAYLAISLGIIFLSLILVFKNFEKKPLKAEEAVIISSLAAIGTVGRVPFAAIPNVQPTTFIIIMTAISFGGRIAFLVASISALASNIILGQGPWTPWQIFAWGIVGLTAGILNKKLLFKNKIILSIFGGICGFLFGWIMNLWGFFYFQSEVLSWRFFIVSCLSSFKFDLAHAITNVIFLYLFSPRWERNFERIKNKYGLLNGGQ